MKVFLRPKTDWGYSSVAAYLNCFINECDFIDFVFFKYLTKRKQIEYENNGRLTFEEAVDIVKGTCCYDVTLVEENNENELNKKPLLLTGVLTTARGRSIPVDYKIIKL